MLMMGSLFIGDYFKKGMEERATRKEASRKRAMDLAHQSVLEKAEEEKEKKQEEIQQTQLNQNDTLSDIKNILEVQLSEADKDRIRQLEKDREEGRRGKVEAPKLGIKDKDGDKESGLMGDFGEAVMGGSIAGFISGKIMEGLKGIKWGKMFGIGALIAGLAWAIKDGFTGMFKAEDWGVSKLSGFVGGFLGGADSGVMGAFKGAG